MQYLLVSFTLLLSSCSLSKMAANGNFEDAIRTGADVFVQDKTIDNDLDFTKLVQGNMISEGVMQGKTAASITFVRCTFKGNVKGFRTDEKGGMHTTIFGRNLSFLQCKFEKEVNLRGAIVMGRADFTGSTFKGITNFEEVSFQENAFFSNAIFQAEARFQNSFFTKKANFMQCTFEKPVNFQSAFFNWEAQFNVAKMLEYADFSLVTFSHDAFFNYIESSKRLVMEGATSRGRFELMNSHLNEANLSNANFAGFCRFNDAQIGTQLNFTNSRLVQKPETEALQMQKVNLTNARMAN
jgi:uncharacterized protein YjbI with pentapeptide repeats